MQNSTTIADIVMVMVASFAVLVVAKKGGKRRGQSSDFAGALSRRQLKWREHLLSVRPSATLWQRLATEGQTTSVNDVMNVACRLVRYSESSFNQAETFEVITELQLQIRRYH